MKKILVFDKGGRKERIKLMKAKKAPKDFLQSIDFLNANGYKIKHLSSTKSYRKNLVFKICSLIEKIQAKISNIGIRPLSVYQFSKQISEVDYVVSLTDGFSMSLGFYYTFFERKNSIKLVGAFHKLSDYDRKIPTILKGIYYKIILNILNRLDYIAFYGSADRDNSISHFNLSREKTHIIKFGVDCNFWIPREKISFESEFLFSIGQDPSRDFETLLKVKTKKRIHIHTSILPKRNDQKFLITSGTYHEPKNSLTDLEVRKLYQDSFAILVPIKDVFQPSGYSVTLQALSCGKPVILTLTKGIWAPKIFNNLENCLLVKPYIEQEIEEAISLLENDLELYIKISKAARKTALKYFSLKQANITTLDLFNKFA